MGADGVRREEQLLCGVAVGGAAGHDSDHAQTLLLVDEARPSAARRGEAYAAKLRMAGVPVTTVRYDGVVHDFMLLNAMSEANATRAAVAQANAFLRAALGTA